MSRSPSCARRAGPCSSARCCTRPSIRPGLVRVHDAVAAIEPPVADTARVFEMNLRVLTERGEVAPEPALGAALAAIARGERAAAPVRWRFRQIAWERSG